MNDFLPQPVKKYGGDMIDSFLPNDYEIPPSQSEYMKLKDGDNRIRILSSAIIGWEWWVDVTDESGAQLRKPKRARMGVGIPIDDLNKDEVDPADVKHFWAFVVYNYDDKQVQILQITQKTIQNEIKKLSKDADWGTPKGYDLVITRTGKKLLTKYQVQPKPAKPVSEEIIKEYERKSINLEKLYDGENPFEQ